MRTHLKREDEGGAQDYSLPAVIRCTYVYMEPKDEEKASDVRYLGTRERRDEPQTNYKRTSS